VTPNLHFKITIFINLKYLENGTKESCTYNGRLIGSRMVLFSMTTIDPNPGFKGKALFDVE